MKNFKHGTLITTLALLQPIYLIMVLAGSEMFDWPMVMSVADKMMTMRDFSERLLFGVGLLAIVYMGEVALTTAIQNSGLQSSGSDDSSGISGFLKRLFLAIEEAVGQKYDLVLLIKVGVAVLTACIALLSATVLSFYAKFALLSCLFLYIPTAALLSINWITGILMSAGYDVSYSDLYEQIWSYTQKYKMEKKENNREKLRGVIADSVEVLRSGKHFHNIKSLEFGTFFRDIGTLYVDLAKVVILYVFFILSFVSIGPIKAVMTPLLRLSIHIVIVPLIVIMVILTAIFQITTLLYTVGYFLAAATLIPINMNYFERVKENGFDGGLLGIAVSYVFTSLLWGFVVFGIIDRFKSCLGPGGHYIKERRRSNVIVVSLTAVAMLATLGFTIPNKPEFIKFKDDFKMYLGRK
jgi:hypothetical protein